MNCELFRQNREANDMKLTGASWYERADLLKAWNDPNDPAVYVCRGGHLKGSGPLSAAEGPATTPHAPSPS